ncbi:MAG: pyruvate kinase [Planctomycetota bacterium]
MRIDTAIKLLKRRRTRIVATVGPASSDLGVLERLIQAGVDIFRLNFSHGDHAGHQQVFERIHKASANLNVPVGVLADLCGPKIRVGKFAGGSIELADGASVIVTVRDVQGEPGIIPSQYTALAGDVKPGDRILLDDGKLELRANTVLGTEIGCTVVHGGTLKDRKGMNLPGVNVSAPSLTEKDRADAAFALKLGVDFIALSFVRRASDINDLRQLINQSGREGVPIVAKIEKPEALENIDEILEATDAIMVARGDLGVELPPESVPVAQDQLVDLAQARCKPVIVATQMLESMIDASRPTRAEVSDVSHAVASGADAVMLSAETASGKHPVAAVEMMDAIARRMEGYQFQQFRFDLTPADGTGAPPLVPGDNPLPLADAVARSTALLSRDLMVRAIIVFSQTGKTAGIMSANRPAAPLIVVTSESTTCRALLLLWGVVPIVATADEAANPEEFSRAVAKQLELAEEGQYVLSVRGFQRDPARDAPSISVVRV